MGSSWDLVICEHETRKKNCRVCSPQYFCQHGFWKYRCKKCKTGRCSHGYSTGGCKTCGSALCEHKKYKVVCIQCSGLKAVATRLLYGARKRAAKEKLPINLTKEYLLCLIGDGRCPVFGFELEFGSGRSVRSFSLDRFDPQLGYVVGNCFVISDLANRIKQNVTAEQVQFVADWMRKIEMTKANGPETSLKKDMQHFEAASEGTRGSKSNGETATLRSGSLPKAEAVRTVKFDEGAAVRCAQRQNTSDQGEYPKKRNVVPNKDDESLIVTSIAKIKE